MWPQLKGIVTKHNDKSHEIFSSGWNNLDRTATTAITLTWIRDTDTNTSHSQQFGDRCVTSRNHDTVLQHAWFSVAQQSDLSTCQCEACLKSHSEASTIAFSHASRRFSFDFCSFINDETSYRLRKKNGLS